MAHAGALTRDCVKWWLATAGSTILAKVVDVVVHARAQQQPESTWISVASMLYSRRPRTFTIEVCIEIVKCGR